MNDWVLLSQDELVPRITNYWVNERLNLFEFMHQRWLESSGLHLSTYKGQKFSLLGGMLMSPFKCIRSCVSPQQVLSGIHLLLNHRFLPVGLFPFHWPHQLKGYLKSPKTAKQCWDSNLFSHWCGAPSDPRVQWYRYVFMSKSNDCSLLFSHIIGLPAFSNRPSIGVVEFMWPISFVNDSWFKRMGYFLISC